MIFFPHPAFTPQTLLAADLALLKDGSVTPGLEFVEMMKLFFLGLLGKGWAVTFGTKPRDLGWLLQELPSRNSKKFSLSWTCGFVTTQGFGLGKWQNLFYFPSSLYGLFLFFPVLFIAALVHPFWGIVTEMVFWGGSIGQWLEVVYFHWALELCFCNGNVL